MKHIFLLVLVSFFNSITIVHAEQIDVNQTLSNMTEQLKGASKERIEAMDEDKDGSVTKKEFVSSQIGRNSMNSRLFFEKIDTNHDGKINVEEYYTALTLKTYHLLLKLSKQQEKEDALKAKEIKKVEKVTQKSASKEVKSEKKTTKKSKAASKKVRKN